MQPSITGGPCDEIAEETPSELACFQPQMPVLAELLCSEPADDEVLKSLSATMSKNDRNSNNGIVGDEPYVQSHFDPVILHHPEVMSRLKILESNMDKPRDYLRNTTNDEILPYMRKIVASWMLEVWLWVYFTYNK